MLREMRGIDNELGRELSAVMDRGDLVNDEMMVRLIESRLSRGDTVSGFVLDGFPRTMTQAEALDELLQKLDREIDVVFDFQLGDRGVLIERMTKRAEEEGRADDTPEAMVVRLDLYERETAPIIEYYRTRQANVVGIHADRSIDEVFAEIERSLQSVEARV